MSQPVISAFDWVPAFARGQVRDLRVRWACEEMGVGYDTQLYDARQPRDADYKAWQPFGQVPALRDGDVEVSETGALLLSLAETHGELLPREGQARWSAISWLFAALSSIEPFLLELVIIGVFHEDKPWSAAALEPQERLARSKLTDLSAALGDREWLAGEFSIADIMMVTVLRLLDHTDMLEEWPNLAAYRRRGMDRPAFRRAFDAQCAEFKPLEGE